MNKKLLVSLSVIGAVAALAVGGTIAYFSDVETSTGNTFTAGSIDLKIDSQCSYNGAASDQCGSWELKDLVPTADKFFNFTDVKPGDSGENTISLHIDNNDAYACLKISNLVNQENGCNEPEAIDDTTCGSAADPGVGLGELQEHLLFTIWEDNGDGADYDPCDNKWENGERVIATDVSPIIQGTELVYPIADSVSGPIPGGQTRCIGVSWTLPATVGNIVQSDSLTGDVSFEVVQARNNQGFVCSGGGDIGCAKKPDVVLTLDQSGSIDSGEMTTLKDAANAFVDALAPSADGSHMGMVSFSTTATLRQELTSDGSLVKAAINALTSQNLTNLEDAIIKSAAELASAGDRNDAESPDFMVIITDGNPTASDGPSDDATDAKNAATDAKTAGIKIYVVGIGGDVNATYLQNDISSGAGYYYSAANWSDLETILKNLGTCK